jgi:hypothetical protein
VYKSFEGQENDIATRTDLRIMLDDPETEDPAFTREVSFTAYGTMRVAIGQPFRTTAAAFKDEIGAEVDADQPLFVLPWSVTRMSARADSELGEITISEVPGKPTIGTVKQLRGDGPFPALLEADVCTALTVPGYGELRTAPILIRAEIDAIPPFGTEAAHRNSGLLSTPEGIPRGILVGRSITLLGPAE